MTQTEALRLALEALKANDLLVKGTETIGGLEWAMDGYYSDCFDIEPVTKQTKEAITAVEAALEAKNEPVGLIESLKDAQPCCGQYETCWRACTPRGKFIGQRDAQRTWVGLTDEEFKDAINDKLTPECIAIAIEAKLKEKNT